MLQTYINYFDTLVKVDKDVLSGCWNCVYYTQLLFFSKLFCKFIVFTFWDVFNVIWINTDPILKYNFTNLNHTIIHQKLIKNYFVIQSHCHIRFSICRFVDFCPNDKNRFLQKLMPLNKNFLKISLAPAFYQISFSLQ